MGCAVCRAEYDAARLEYDAARLEYDAALEVEQDLYAKLSFHRDACLKVQEYSKRHGVRYFDDSEPVGLMYMDLRADWDRALLEWQPSLDALTAIAARQRALLGTMMDGGCGHA